MALTEYRQAIEDLWSEGYTLVRRQSDPFEIDARLIPRGRSYQWNSSPGNRPGTSECVNPLGWVSVPWSRHPGVFAPWTYNGDDPIMVQGLYLCERPEAEVKDARAEVSRKVRQQVVDWGARAAGDGISGSVSIGGVGMDVGPAAEQFKTQGKTIETTVNVPMEMFPYMDEVFAERDRLKDEIVQPDRTLKPGKIADRFYAEIEADPGAPWWHTLLAILLPLAVDRVRENHPEIGS